MLLALTYPTGSSQVRHPPRGPASVPGEVLLRPGPGPARGLTAEVSRQPEPRELGSTSLESPPPPAPPAGGLGLAGVGKGRQEAEELRGGMGRGEAGAGRLCRCLTAKKTGCRLRTQSRRQQQHVGPAPRDSPGVSASSSSIAPGRSHAAITRLRSVSLALRGPLCPETGQASHSEIPRSAFRQKRTERPGCRSARVTATHT